MFAKKSFTKMKKIRKTPNSDQNLPTFYYLPSEIMIQISWDIWDRKKSFIRTLKLNSGKAQIFVKWLKSAQRCVDICPRPSKITFKKLDYVLQFKQSTSFYQYLVRQFLRCTVLLVYNIHEVKVWESIYLVLKDSWNLDHGPKISLHPC